MDEKEAKRIQEELEKIKKMKESALNKSQEELNKIDQRRNPQTYTEGEKEVEKRNEELNKVNSEIESFNKLNEDIKGLNVDAIKKERLQKAEALKKAQEELNKFDQRRDPQTYAEGENEVSKRQEELNKVDEEYKKIINEEKDLKEKLSDLLESFNKKYHIEKEEKQNQKPVKKEEKENSNTNVEEKDDNKEKLAKQIAEKEAEIKASEKRMSNFGSHGFDGQAELAKYKKLMKELEELKSGKVNKENIKKDNENRDKNKKYYSPTQEEIEEYMNLRNKGYDDNSPEMKEFLKNLTKKREMQLERDENGNLKYLPAEQKTTTTLPAKSIEKTKQIETDNVDERLSIIYSGKDNKYIVSNFEKILAKVEFENENDKLKYISDITKKLSQPIEAKNFKNKKAKLEYLKDEFDEEDLKYIFGEKYNKTMKKMAKTYDPQLLVLLSDLDMDYAKKYINELSKGEDDKKEKLPYSMKYNLKGMRKNHKENKMSFIQRIRANRMAKKNHEKGVAEYVPDDKSRKWLAVPVIGALAAGGIAIANNENTQEQPKQDHTPDISVGVKPENQNKNQNKNQEIPTDEIINAVDQVSKDTVKNNTDDLVLGSRVNLQDGVTYAENSLQGGIKGKIGEVSWRPAGDYTIDRVAIYHNGKLLENISAEGTNVDETVRKYAEKLGVNPSEIDQKAHICVGEKHDGATGWIDMEETSMQELKNSISKTYNQLQQEKAVNNKQQTQKTTQEQDHEDR
ncbi:MAG: hypothetical protein J6K42_00815 [Clostridia bacterium]|nr:hypothetical protein [Clostridia bacterium]